ncbi:MAG TPA: hypothetical protein VN207_09935 [Ktedonobacteraceae bacterium]|nr:hypothetical protein [Ktedonobacteraceae bacterium]
MRGQALGLVQAIQPPTKAGPARAARIARHPSVVTALPSSM